MLIFYPWQCALKKTTFAKEKLRELVTEPLTHFSARKFSKTELRGPGIHLDFTYQRESKIKNKEGGFLCNKDIFLKQIGVLYRELGISGSFSCTKMCTIYWSLFPLQMSQCASQTSPARGSSWKPGGRNIPSSATS